MAGQGDLVLSNLIEQGNASVSLVWNFQFGCGPEGWLILFMSIYYVLLLCHRMIILA